MAGETQRFVLRLLVAAMLAGVGAAELAAQESDDENAVVGQTITWEGNEDALRYELIIDDVSGQEIYHQSLETTTVSLHLKPGTYRYRVLVYNVLDQREADTSWQDLVVLRAEIPGPRVVIPNTLYLENPVLKFKVQGILLVEGAQYKLYRQDKPNISAVGEVVTHSGDQEVELRFPGFDFSYGDYALTIQNPGGLKHTLKNALKVRYQKPVDIRFSVGYAPVVALWDSWYKSTWNQGFYPLGADARLNVVFLKRVSYQLGAELESDFWEEPGGIPAAIINTRDLTAGANLVYSFLLTKQWLLNVRLGGGMMAGFYSFDYQGTAGASWNSVDPYVRAEAGVSYFITKFWFAEADVGVINGFGNRYMMGLLQPRLMLGLSY
jgi:hypothetical protein